MVAIFQQNPQAFDGNINLLRSGSTLRLPDASEIQAISAAAAQAEVARQYDAWSKGTRDTPAQVEAARLRLVTPEQGTTAPSTAVAQAPVTAPAAAQASTPAAAAAPVTAAPDAAAGADPAATDIDTRVQQLESELAEARRLLEVRNAELATLQGGAAASPAAAATPAADAPSESTLLQRLLGYWWVLLGLIAAALGALVFARIRRERGAAEESLEEALASSRSNDLRSAGYQPRPRDAIVVEEKKPVEPARVAVRPTPVPAAEPVAAPAAPAQPAATRRTEAPRKHVNLDETYSGEGLTPIDASDPLAEADFHMAYGLYDQAADLVRLALEREPQRRDLKLKLLEIFFVWGNKDRFLAQARELHESRAEAAAGEWDKVLIMGKQIAPGETMFAGSPSAGSGSLDLELHGTASTLDLDMELPEGEGDGAGGSERGASAHADSDGLDFVLDDGTQGASDAPSSPTLKLPRMRAAAGGALGDTQKLAVEDLGLDLETLRQLEELGSDTAVTPAARPQRFDDTVVTPRPSSAQRLPDLDEGLTSSMATLDEDGAMLEPG
ncbi:MAG: type IV pilus assembly protein FimV, partial [Steroidobacteraceae bacterium]